MARRSSKVPISVRALVKRLNRRLGEDGEQLRRARAGTRQAESVGAYYRTSNARVVDRDVDLIALGRRLGVLRDFEVVDQGAA